MFGFLDIGVGLLDFVVIVFGYGCGTFWILMCGFLDIDVGLLGY